MYIEPSRFIKAAKPTTQEAYAPANAFADFELDALLKNNLREKGFVTPTAIQDQTIPLALSGADIIGIANTGTGKTAAFSLPILHKLMQHRTSRVLIVAPTRELAQQIEDEIRTLAKGSGLAGAVLIGGAPIRPQLRNLKARPQIVIGTPGRIKDHVSQRSLDLSTFDFVVLDEVDRMLDMGFVDDVTTILRGVGSGSQSFFFSATMDPRIEGLIRTFSKDPQTVAVKTGDTSDNVEQNVVRFGGTTEKMELLHDLLLKEEVSKAIVFDETQRQVEKLGKELAARGFQAGTIHGGKSQGQRQRALDSFKKNDITILVATDVAARGIDVVDISHVINYSQPQTYQDYVHRIGRAGRAGRSGHALTFVPR
jgi:superfamily II DNA/RNA helicase